MKRAIFFILLFFLYSCNLSPDRKIPVVIDASGLIAIDKEFSDYSVRHGINSAFLKYAADDAVMLRPGGYPVEGIKAIRDRLAGSNDTSFSLKWDPVKAVIAGSGDLGYTYGIYTLTLKDTVQRGTYITIWKKMDGNWKFVFDAGNEGLGE